MTREQIETALDAGKLFVNVGPGKYWEARRNGRTQLWKTRPNDFRVPIKYGLRGTGEISHRNQHDHGTFRIAESRQAAESGHDRYGNRVAFG